MPCHSRGRRRDPRKTRLLALAGVLAACAVALPLAVASAGSVSGAGAHDSGSGAQTSDDNAPADDKPLADDKAPAAVRCGPELSSPDGIEAQTCVVRQGTAVWARTYYRNATGEALDAVLSLMGPDDRTVRMTCAVGAEDEPRTCETPREPARGEPAAYTAVAEFAQRGGQGPLLLRSGSNSPAWTGS
ncbi:hypothetical protein [Streptomyces lomondensis]|uniref:Secreted protein n=1 Tax=Streptomyces lomondensis TaxID=68229 RepID=A0ABQ2XHL2_9ACTN|nr:hypothetical protein [Streptomyces lomondensis]MCF0080344.1 hypothetical protein [Streptomyces lomondensis]GGX16224.1 hypothetical protein GCM10010383_52760 [Streptomyces lomondensis]